MSHRIALIDPHEIVRQGLRHLFATKEYERLDLYITGESAADTDMIPLYETGKPEIIITEVLFPGWNGLENIDRLKQTFPEVKVFVYTGTDNPTFLARAAVIGVEEYLEKSASMTVFRDAITNLCNNHPRSASHRLNQVQLLMRMKRVPQEREIPLTGREMQVLRHIAFGMSNKEIARSLSLSVETIKEHVQNVLRKMGLKDRTQAAVWAVRKKLI
ncbi:MAG: response regulator transcription factor [Planctomycetaceae bacterium]|nr:response regulator transcription factor [Planctomycetaceae bacterium]